MCLMVISLALAGVYIWYSTAIPETCDTDLHNWFLIQGILLTVSALLVGVSTCAMKEMFTAASHAALAQKYEEEHRIEEAAEEKKEFQEDTAKFGKVMSCVAAFSCFVQLGIFANMIYGVTQAVNATEILCGDAVVVFWVLFALSAIQFCCNFFKVVCGHKEQPEGAESE